LIRTTNVVLVMHFPTKRLRHESKARNPVDRGAYFASQASDFRGLLWPVVREVWRAYARGSLSLVSFARSGVRLGVMVGRCRMKLPAIHFFPGDWLRDNVAGCSLAAQGLWLRMIILMHDSERYGHLCLSGSPIPSESLARRCGCDSLTQFDALLAELDAAAVPSRTNKGVIYSRRMVRDDKKRKQASYHGKRGGNPALLKPPSEVTLKGQDNPRLILPPEDESENAVDSFCNREGIGEGLRSYGFPEAWRDWRAYRAEIREPLSSFTSRQQLLKCERMGSAKARDAIRRAIENSWKNIKEDHELIGNGSGAQPRAPSNTEIMLR
jgi:hypothetical protein